MKIQKILNFGVILALVPHLFCCVLPIVLAVLSLVAPVDSATHIHIVPHDWMPWLLVISGVMLAISYYFVWRGCHCECNGCQTRGHRTQKVILIVATVLFAVSLILHFVGH